MLYDKAITEEWHRAKVEVQNYALSQSLLPTLPLTGVCIILIKNIIERIARKQTATNVLFSADNDLLQMSKRTGNRSWCLDKSSTRFGLKFTLQ